MKFIADRTLGKLARKLRMLGFDVLYWRGGTLSGALEAARAEGRVLLTRSRKTGEKAEGAEVAVIGADDPEEQLREVRRRLPPAAREGKLFSRCLICNEELRPLAREDAQGRVPDFIGETHKVFHACPRCRRIYWPGTHYQSMKRALAGFFSDPDSDRPPGRG